MQDGHADVALAVDIGGTKVDAALVTRVGQVVPGTASRRPTGRGSSREEIASSITQAAASALEHLTAEQRLVGVGIGSAGPVDLPHGAVSPINLPAARGLAVVELLSSLAPGVPVRLALDGTCIALAEHWRGALAGCRTGLAMVVSTGIGGGFIANDLPVTGVSGNAGHIGQIRLEARVDDDPFVGTVEAIGSGTATVAWAREQGWPGATGEDLAAAYRAGDDIAIRAVRRSADAVGRAIATAATLFDLEAVAIAGGFVNVADDYIELVRDAAHESAALPYARAVRVERSSLGGDGPLLGAAALVLR
ncbi:ROK family protein [Microbacterium sp. 4R-513]|uniref:ROK family protein n=1 Tax=Microbacterium sp. 4R-513 TaxID=2567934 RepID=UPI0013E158EF|nr:ROK family protein [Microbacterium sp. 4R-513]QIG39768.1 ROK family protein [Microbacterium sp. 4R-513]